MGPDFGATWFASATTCRVACLPWRIDRVSPATETFTPGLPTTRSPSSSPGMSTVVAGQLHRRDSHPLEQQLASLHPRFLGEPPCVHALLFDPDGISAPGHPAPRCSLPHGQRRRLPRRSDSRGSSPRPARSLCTLRSEDHSSTTQHSVPAGGPPLPGGVGYPLGSPRRVSAVIHPAWRSPSPGFSWRNDRICHTALGDSP